MTPRIELIGLVNVVETDLFGNCSSNQSFIKVRVDGNEQLIPGTINKEALASLRKTTEPLYESMGCKVPDAEPVEVEAAPFPSPQMPMTPEGLQEEIETLAGGDPHTDSDGVAPL